MASSDSVSPKGGSLLTVKIRVSRADALEELRSQIVEEFHVSESLLLVFLRPNCDHKNPTIEQWLSDTGLSMRFAQSLQDLSASSGGAGIALRRPGISLFSSLLV